MTLEGWVQWATIAAQAASTVAIVAAAFRYFHARDVQSGETLRLLEERFKSFHSPWRTDSGVSMPPITRAIEKDSGEFHECGLEAALEKGIEGKPGTRDERERLWIPRLDELLRFLMIVCVMGENRLLKPRALWDAYHYWYRSIDGNVLLRTYVGLHFPVLYSFLDENRKNMSKYTALQQETGVAAMAAFRVHRATVARNAAEHLKN